MSISVLEEKKEVKPSAVMNRTVSVIFMNLIQNCVSTGGVYMLDNPYDKQ